MLGRAGFAGPNGGNVEAEWWRGLREGGGGEKEKKEGLHAGRSIASILHRAKYRRIEIAVELRDDGVGWGLNFGGNGRILKGQASLFRR